MADGIADGIMVLQSGGFASNWANAGLVSGQLEVEAPPGPAGSRSHREPHGCRQVATCMSRSRGPRRGLCFLRVEAFVVHDDGCARCSTRRSLALGRRAARLGGPGGWTGRKQMRRASSRHSFRVGLGVGVGADARGRVVLTRWPRTCMLYCYRVMDCT